jgi:uncharacterized protein YaaN involved in tellurite resistance
MGILHRIFVWRRGREAVTVLGIFNVLYWPSGVGTWDVCDASLCLCLWKQQLAQAVTVYRASEAAKTVKEATDLTNELLRKNADMLRDASAEARRQAERGIVDIEAVKYAHAQLIATIEEGLQIADEGKWMRSAAEKELVSLEATLKETLALASARAKPQGSI